jgi:hypothetical protein
VIHLDDFFLRRSILAKLGQITHANLVEIAEIIGGVLGLSVNQRNREIQRIKKLLKENHGIFFESA